MTTTSESLWQAFELFVFHREQTAIHVVHIPVNSRCTYFMKHIVLLAFAMVKCLVFPLHPSQDASFLLRRNLCMIVRRDSFAFQS